MIEHNCPKCGEKDINQFWKDRRKGLNGLQTYCKDCSRNKRKEWADSNQASVKKYSRDYYNEIRNDPERWENQLRESAKYRKKKRYHSQIAWNNHRAKTEFNQLDKLTTKEWLALLGQFANFCPGCKTPWYLCGSATVDHIKPLALKGKNNIKNIQPLCRSCNVKKSKRVMKFIRRKQDESI